MKFLIVFAAILAFASANPYGYGYANYGYAAAPAVYAAPIAKWDYRKRSTILLMIRIQI